MQHFKRRTSKIVSRSLALVLSFAMLMASVAVMPTAIEAAKKATVRRVSITKPATSVLVLKKGKTYSLKAAVAVTPNKSANKKVTFSTNNKKVATVTASGKIKAVSNGKAVITVKSKMNNKKSAKITVRVGTPITKVSLNKSALSLSVGDTETLTAAITPKKVTYKQITWTSSNQAVAKVTSGGVVSALSKGTAKITALAADGSGKKAVCTVEVAEKVTTSPTPTPTPTKMPPPTLDPNKKTYMLEDFESYEAGTKWDKLTGSYAAGSMTVVEDPEDPNNKLLAVSPSKGYDYAPVISKALPEGKTLNDYESVNFKVRVVTNITDIVYKRAVAYFAKKDTITKGHQFFTAADPSQSYYKEEESKFQQDKIMAGGKKPGDDWNQHFPAVDSAAEPEIGFSDDPTNVDKKVGFKTMTLTFFPEMMVDQGVANKGLDLTTLNEFDMVIGAGYPPMETGDTLTWYIDDIQLIEK